MLILLVSYKKQPEITLRVYAYTDNIGSHGFNKKLSIARAKAINELLQGRGIAANRISVYGEGEDNPIAENDTEEGRAINRRGEFHFSTMPQNYNLDNDLDSNLDHNLDNSNFNNNPGAFNDYFTLEANGVLAISPETLFKNDNSDTLRLQSYTQPEHGQLAMNSAGDFVFRASEGFIGTDTFTYTTTDSAQSNVTVAVSVAVLPDVEISLEKVHYVNFAYDSTDLTPGSMAKVIRIASQLKKQPEVTLRIYTYTDNVGSKRFNRKLSRARAVAVNNLLQEKDISENRIRAYGKGEDEPIAENNTEEGRAINRRGEFHFRN